MSGKRRLREFADKNFKSKSIELIFEKSEVRDFAALKL